MVQQRSIVTIRGRSVTECRIVPTVPWQMRACVKCSASQWSITDSAET